MYGDPNLLVLVVGQFKFHCMSQMKIDTSSASCGAYCHPFAIGAKADVLKRYQSPKYPDSTYLNGSVCYTADELI